jgi:hypothetical protein
MEFQPDKELSPFNEACQTILFERPEAIGVAYRILDCGCALLCGVSAGGDPIGLLRHISSRRGKKGSIAPICLKCRKNDGLDRVIWDGIYWPGTRSEWPNKDLRISIGRKVFGPNYMERE